MDSGAWNARYADGEFVWTVHPNRFLVEEAASLPPGRALDLACGEGRNAVWLAQRGWTVTGVDFSAVGIEKARRLAAEHAVHPEWIVADVLDYRPEPRAFDLVIVLYLQLPPGQRQAVVRAAARALASGGTLLIVAHDSENIERGYGGPQDPTVLCSTHDLIADLGGTDVRSSVPSRPAARRDSARATGRARRSPPRHSPGITGPENTPIVISSPPYTTN